VFNVGNSGNWLVNDLGNSSGWRAMTATRKGILEGKYPNEAVWTARQYVDAPQFMRLWMFSTPALYQ
ncbi:MAG: hypothetical protein ACXVJF_14875, partial [Acidimicrobiia bacterium]